MEYTILNSNEFIKLIQMVNHAIAKGWAPQGGVTVGMDQGYQVYAQAMIKEAK
jgi:hypothetical protein